MRGCAGLSWARLVKILSVDAYETCSDDSEACCEAAYGLCGEACACGGYPEAVRQPEALTAHPFLFLAMNATLEPTGSRPRGRRPKLKSDGDELPKLTLSAAQLWTCREVSRVLSVSRAEVTEAVRSGRLPCEPETPGQRARRVLAADAVRVLAPAFLPRIKFL